MLKIIHVTDTHLVGQGTRLYGLDPHERLKKALADINRQHGDAHAIVITGDLTNWGGKEEYDALSDALETSALPLRLVLGNHDHRDRFRAAFPEAMAGRARICAGYRGYALRPPGLSRHIDGGHPCGISV